MFFLFATKPRLSRLQVISIAALWISLLPNLATLISFATAPDAGTGWRWIGFVLLGWIFTLTVTTLLLVVIGVFFWGRSIQWFCAAMIVLASILGFYSYFLGIQFDRSMLINMIQTHTSEAFELIGWRLLSWVFLVGVLPALFLVTRSWRPVAGWWRITWTSVLLVIIPLMGTSLMALTNYQGLASAVRNHAVTFHTLAPANLLAASISYGYVMHTSHLLRQPLGQDAKIEYPLKKPRLVVLVLGETARAQNQFLNGYARDTNARVRQEDIVYFKDTQSCGTSTAVSVPCIFSGLKQSEFSLLKARQRETLIDVVRHAGTHVLWRDNDAGCKEVCDKAQFEDFTDHKDPKWCSEPGNCFDEILLEGLEQRLNTMTQDTLLVLHLKGSHGPAYFKRYPKAFEKFQPVCQSNELSACDVASIRNAYDNTLVYTDHVLGRVINLLKSQENRWATAMLYVSDHGESLGENGLFLHGVPRSFAPKEQTTVPMLAWLSSPFMSMERWDKSCVHQQNAMARSHDNVYHTILGLLDISTKEYSPHLDLFSACDKKVNH
jgi:lipid A ethanolaminephosphotransferase